MQLISCPECAVVLDITHVHIGRQYKDDGTISDEWEWNGGEYVPAIPCPVCQHRIQFSDYNQI